MPLPERPYYLLHTLVGYMDTSSSGLLFDGDGEWLAPYSDSRPAPSTKIDLFLRAEPETPEGVTQSLILDRREVMTTVSKPDPAVVYHRPYGLVLDGKIRECFDDDTGKVLQTDGTYNSNVFDFTRPTSPDELLGEWYDSFAGTRKFTWNEAILEKGSEVIGAFRDPRLDNGHHALSPSEKAPTEYELFMAKVARCGLGILDITAKHGVFPDKAKDQ